MEHWLNDTDGETPKRLGKNLSQWHVIYLKSYVDILRNSRAA